MLGCAAVRYGVLRCAVLQPALRCADAPCSAVSLLFFVVLGPD